MNDGRILHESLCLAHVCDGRILQGVLVFEDRHMYVMEGYFKESLCLKTGTCM